MLPETVMIDHCTHIADELNIHTDEIALNVTDLFP
jgi:hypothetical protein